MGALLIGSGLRKRGGAKVELKRSGRRRGGSVLLDRAMGLLSILKKMRQKERELRLLMLYPSAVGKGGGLSPLIN